MSVLGKIELPWRRSLVRACPDCGRLVVWPNNDVLLDWPAVPFSEILGTKWTVQRYLNTPIVSGRHTGLSSRGGTKYLALPYKGPSANGTGHALHEHQPPTSATRRGGPLAEYAPVVREKETPDG